MMTPRIAVLGSVNVDLVVTVERLPQPGETVLGGDVVQRSGGKGANQAVAARRYGAHTSLYASIGRDDFGAQLADGLRQEGIDISTLRWDEERPSGAALIVVDDAGANTITVAAGANDSLTADSLTDLDMTLPETDTLVLQLETPEQLVLDAAHHAVRHSVAVTVNAAPLPSQITPALWELLTLTDVLIVNETEAQALFARGSSWAERARSLLEHGPRVAVITLGSAGAVAAYGEQVITHPGIPVDVVDTTGAGDTFCAVFTVELRRSDDLHRALAHACAAGALATTRMGAREGMPASADVAALLASTTHSDR